MSLGMVAVRTRRCVALGSSARGCLGYFPRVGLGSSARGGLGASARGGFGALSSSPHVGTGFSATAVGSSRGFSSFLRNFEPSDKAVRRFELLGAMTMITAATWYGFHCVEQENQQYLDGKMIEVKAFQNLATSIHEETVFGFDAAVDDVKTEVSDLREKILAMEQKEFQHKKALLVADDILKY